MMRKIDYNFIGYLQSTLLKFVISLSHKPHLLTENIDISTLTTKIINLMRVNALILFYTSPYAD